MNGSFSKTKALEQYWKLNIQLFEARYNLSVAHFLY